MSHSCSFFYAKVYLRGNIFALLMSTFTRRDRLTIFAEILKAAKDSGEGKNKTNIMQSVNLNGPQANKYLHLLLMNGLIYLDGKDRYKPTEKGLELIKTLESLDLRSISKK